jgi:hypothetical protein
LYSYRERRSRQIGFLPALSRSPPTVPAISGAPSAPFAREKRTSRVAVGASASQGIDEPDFANRWQRRDLFSSPSKQGGT